jgi:hypothetical protein
MATGITGAHAIENAEKFPDRAEQISLLFVNKFTILAGTLL